MIQLGFLKILKGSPMADIASAYDYSYDEYPPYEIIKNKWISCGEIFKLKAIASIVDKYHNSQSFTNILNYSIENHYKNNEFDFFEHLSCFFDINKYTDIKLPKPRLYEIMAEFFASKNIFDSKAKTLISFDFLLNNSAPLPKVLHLKEITKNTLYELIQKNIFAIPQNYKTLPYKQLIKHFKVFEFEMNPLNFEDKKTCVAFWDVKNKNISSHKEYTFLSL
jgi:hypothetical protein